MLAVKVSGIEFSQADERRLESTMHVTVQLKGLDGTARSSAATAASSRTGSTFVWNEELSLWLSPDAASVMSSL
eukprot:2352872-Prymnesium_polylepis.1